MPVVSYRLGRLLLNFLLFMAHDVRITMKRAGHFPSVVGHIHVVALSLYLVIVLVVGLNAFLQVVDVDQVVFVALFVRVDGDAGVDVLGLLLGQLIILILNFFIMNSFNQPRLQRVAVGVFSVHCVSSYFIIESLDFLGKEPWVVVRIGSISRDKTHAVGNLPDVLELTQIVQLRRLVLFQLLKLRNVDAVTYLCVVHGAFDALVAFVSVTRTQVAVGVGLLEVGDGCATDLVGRVRCFSSIWLCLRAIFGWLAHLVPVLPA